LVFAIASLLITAVASAQSTHTKHTYKLDDISNRPTATLADVGWLTGSWTGDAFEGTFEEVWNPPSAGTMVGMFKVLKDNKVVFYELMLLAEDEGSVSLKVKHFTDEFIAWEEKPDFITFRLVKIEEGAIHFSGLSFYRIDTNEIHAYIALHESERVWEEQLIYRRVQ